MADKRRPKQVLEQMSPGRRKNEDWIDEGNPGRIDRDSSSRRRTVDG
jgi:hypothetical protein